MKERRQMRQQSGVVVPPDAFGVAVFCAHFTIGVAAGSVMARRSERASHVARQRKLADKPAEWEGDAVTPIENAERWRKVSGVDLLWLSWRKTK